MRIINDIKTIGIEIDPEKSKEDEVVVIDGKVVNTVRSNPITAGVPIKSTLDVVIGKYNKDKNTQKVFISDPSEKVTIYIMYK